MQWQPVFILIILNATFLMQWSLTPIYLVLALEDFHKSTDTSVQNLFLVF